MTRDISPSGDQWKAAADPHVRLDHVELQHGATRFAFDCALARGAVTAVVGPSGAGKSTLLNLIAGFDKPDRGRVVIDGADMSGRHPSQRPVTFVFQDHNLFSHLDLFTNIGLGLDPALKLKESDRAQIAAALARVGLQGFERRLPATLSGGERQRAAFARALVRRRPLLLLDEPFAALDPGLRLDMAELLLELRAELSLTVIIVSHDPQEVERLADRVLFIDAGAILLNDDVEAFRQRKDIPILNRFLNR